MLALATTCAALLAGLLAAPAAAYHIPGATYNGFVSGGGSISFRVSDDGSSVTNLSLNGPINTGSCSTGSKQYSQPTPITNNSFNNGEVSGSFPRVQGASGHIDVVVLGIPSSCRVTATWGAWTNASPAGSEECKAAQAQVKKWKRALNKAKKTGNEKKIKKLRGKWAGARDQRDRVC
jgi:hypothetical protein